MKQSCLTCKFGKPEKVEGRHYCKLVTYTRKHDCGHTCGCAAGKYEPQKETPTKMDKQTAIINHRHMWNWLSENPNAGKRDYLRAHNIESYPKTDCFLCEYMNEQEEWDCRKCILMWPHHDSACDEGSELYIRWRETTNPTHRAELARQIRDLPERGKEPFYVIDPATFGGLGVEGTHTATEAKAVQQPYPPPKLTRADAIAKTREQWRWYARYPEEYKIAYFVKNHIANIPFSECYLCELIRTDQRGGTSAAFQVAPDGCGDKCPLQWPGGCCSFGSIQPSLFELWLLNPTKPNLRIAVANLIANLPEKEE